jgi:hypothetical protein
MTSMRSTSLPMDDKRGRNLRRLRPTIVVEMKGQS